jgi:hypothetical protein
MEPDESARRIFDAYRAGDLAAIQGLIAHDIVVHMPGRNLLSGDYTGLGAALALVARAAAYFDPGSTRLIDVDVNEGEIAARVEIGASVRAPHIGALRLTQRMRISEAGQIVEAWIEPDEPAAWDEFVGSVSEDPSA